MHEYNVKRLVASKVVSCVIGHCGKKKGELIWSAARMND